MPPTGTLLSPTGQRVTANPAEHLARIAELRAQALATPISDAWDEMDMATYLRHLDETEAALKGETR